jgi:hypothetical protein
MAMFNSSDDMIAFVGEVGKKIPDILPRIQRAHLAIPPPMAKMVKKGIKAWRRVVARYENNDFRHDTAELSAIGDLAQWLVAMHVEMANRARIAKGMLPEPVPQITIEERRMVKREILYG